MKLLIVLFALSIFAFFARANMLPHWVHVLNSKGYDKHAHFTIFFILQILCVFVFPKYPPLSIAFFLVLVGVMVEISQELFTKRTGDVLDVFSNMAGVQLGVFLIELFNYLKIKSL